jgi:hypothetical protein
MCGQGLLVMAGSHVFYIGLQATTTEISSYMICQTIGCCTTGSQSSNKVHKYDAPARFSCAVRDILNNTYNDRWISGGGPTAWLPRSPD